MEGILLWISSKNLICIEVKNLYTKEIEFMNMKKESTKLSNVLSLFGWAGGIRTHACQSQSLVPYRLATAQ